MKTEQFLHNQNYFSLVIGLLILFNTNFVFGQQQTTTMQDLFKSLKSHPQTEGDLLNIVNAKSGIKLANSYLYPSINGFGTYDNYSVATGMLPVPPNELITMVQDPNVPQPFSENIFRAGAILSMPIFIKSIFTTVKKAKYLYKSAEEKQYINLLQNEAIIVSSNANIQYITALSNALETKKQSLLKTKEIIALKVNNGRAPGSNLLIINNAINQVEVTKNDIAINKAQAISIIETLAGIRLNSPITMLEASVLDSSSVKSLLPLKEKLMADKLGYRAEQEKLLPSIMLRGSYSYNYAKAYNNNLSIDNDYTTIGVLVSIPIFNKSQYSQISQSKISYKISQNDYDKQELSLKSEVNQLQNSLQILRRSENLYQQNIIDQEELLKIAKVSYESQRISIEDYLKYEDDLILEKSKLYKTQAEKWQTLMKLAVIYGNNIENLVR